MQEKINGLKNPSTHIAKTTVKIKMLHIFLSNIFLPGVLYSQAEFYVLRKKIKNKKNIFSLAVRLLLACHCISVIGLAVCLF